MNGEKKFEGVERELTERIIGAAIEVHRELGCGLKEEAYEAALCWELLQRGLKVERQVPCPVVYKGIVLSDSAPTSPRSKRFFPLSVPPDLRPLRVERRRHPRHRHQHPHSLS